MNKEINKIFGTDKPSSVTNEQYFKRMPQRKNHKSMSGEELLNKIATKDLTRDDLNRIVKK